MERSQTATESVSAADFAELLRTQGTDLRRVDVSRIPRRRARLEHGWDPESPAMSRDVVARLGRARAIQAGSLVGLAVTAVEVGAFVPVQQSGGEWTVSLFLEPARARELAGQLLLAAGRVPVPGGSGGGSAR